MKKTSFIKKAALMTLGLAFLGSCAEDVTFTFPSGDGVIVEDEYREVYLGKFNVLARYHNSNNSEYVSVEDGSVTFTVFDKEGARAGGAVVSGMPGMGSQTFTADSNGDFTVPKDELPVGEPSSGYTAAVTYRGVTEASANNTYVPCKVNTRLILSTAPTLNSSAQMSIQLILQRKVSDSRGWETAPSYLGLPSSHVLYVYEVPKDAATGLIDLVEYDSRVVGSINISSTSVTNLSQTMSIAVSRLVAQTYLDGTDTSISNYSTATPIWDNEVHYMTAQFNMYYGEEPILNGVIEMAPIQMIPLLDTVTTPTDATTHATYTAYDSFDRLNFRFLSSPTDYYAGTSPYIDYSLLFEQTLIQDSASASSNSFDYFYVPNIMARATADATTVFRTEFSITLQQGSDPAQAQSVYNAAVPISSSSYYLTDCFVGSTVRLVSTNWMFKSYSAGTIRRYNELTNDNGTTFDYYITNSTDLNRSLYMGISIVP